MQNKRILICTDMPFFHRMRGNYNRVRSIYNCLKNSHDIDVLFFIEKDMPNNIFADNINYYSDFLPKKHNTVTILQPYNISSKVKYEYKLAFDNFIEKNKDYDFIIFEYIWLSYLIDVKPKTNAKFIIDTHDPFSERTKSLEEFGYKFTSACSVEDEKFCLRNFDYIMAISDNEKEVFESMGYNNVFTAKYFYKPVKNKIKLGFIGGQSIHNIDSINWFYENVYKDTLEDKYLLYICGGIANSPEVMKLKGLKGIVIYEYIWNIEDFYSMVDICINPCRIGSGLKIKNIEAISFKKPIITSDIGLQGMAEEVKLGLIHSANNKKEWIDLLSYFEEEDNLKDTILQMEFYDINNSDKDIYKDLLNILK